MNIRLFEHKAKEHQESFVKFLNKLDHVIPDNLDNIVRKLDEKVWQKVDCTSCANCCKTMTPIYLPEDITRIAAHLNLSEKDFFDTYLEVEAETNSVIHKALPCVFLKDNLCSIYEVRPIDCKEFPHHNKIPFDEYNDTFIQNIDKCPATYLLVKKLKKKLEKEYDDFNDSNI